MTKDKNSTRKNIIESTIDLIKEEMDIKEITIRGIAKNADISKSMINYYFDSKEKLIDEAVQVFINNVIDDSENIFKKLDLNPQERFKARVKSAATFLAENPGISRVSILRDLKNGNENDNSSRVVKAYCNYLKEIFGDEDEKKLIIMSQQIVAALQEIFLRASIFKTETDIDFYNKGQRDKLVDEIIDNIIN